MSAPMDFRDDVFIINPSNRKYYQGSQARPSSGVPSCLVLFLFPFVLAGVLISVLSVYQIYTFVNLTWNSDTARGTFISKVEYTDSDDDTTYHVTYSYVVNDKTYTTESSVPYDVYQSADNGEPLRVIYTKHDPSLADLTPPQVFLPIFLVIFAIAWDGFIGAVVWALLTQRRRWARLAKEGQRIYGKITQVESHEDSDSDLHLTVSYEFRSPLTMQPLRGKNSQIRNDLKKSVLPTVGTTVVALYVNDKLFDIL